MFDLAGQALGQCIFLPMAGLIRRCGVRWKVCPPWAQETLSPFFPGPLCVERDAAFRWDRQRGLFAWAGNWLFSRFLLICRGGLESAGDRDVPWDKKRGRRGAAGMLALGMWGMRGGALTQCRTGPAASMDTRGLWEGQRVLSRGARHLRGHPPPPPPRQSPPFFFFFPLGRDITPPNIDRFALIGLGPLG